MAYRCSGWIPWGLAVALLGCNPEAGDGAIGEGGTLESESSSGALTTGGSTAGNTASTSSGGGGTAPGRDDGDAESTLSAGGGGSTGGVEEGGGQPTTFGMSDDMPLAADIPDIKHGNVDEGTWIAIEQVWPSTGQAGLAGDAWFYVRDPVAEEHMGLRVTLQPGDAMPASTRWVDLVGYVYHDAQGWYLELDTAIEGGLHPRATARRVRIATLHAPYAEVFDDSVVDVAEPGTLVVTDYGTIPGTFFVSSASPTQPVVLVDPRPFGLADAALQPGTPLSRLRGVVELGGPEPMILPRIANDLVVGG